GVERKRNPSTAAAGRWVSQGPYPSYRLPAASRTNCRYIALTLVRARISIARTTEIAKAREEALAFPWHRFSGNRVNGPGPSRSPYLAKLTEFAVESGFSARRRRRLRSCPRVLPAGRVLARNNMRL